MGDHGMRYGPWRKTAEGRAEHLQPVLRMVLPKWLLEKTNATDALHINRDMYVDHICDGIGYCQYTSANCEISMYTDNIQYHHKYYTLLSIVILIQCRITTKYDLHHTLKHILNFDRPTMLSVPEGSKSLLTVIDRNRTCQDAKVPPEYCGCLPWEPVKSNRTHHDPIVFEVACIQSL
jgi:hypothetical protein